MARSMWLPSIVSVLLASIVSLAVASPPYVVYPPREPLEGSVQNGYTGFVTEVTRNSITIQWTTTPGEKPKKFAVSETLAAGKVPKEPRQRPGERHTYRVSPSEMYRLTDVKVGDAVFIDYARINGVDICDHICIVKRPDGLVPPLPKEAEDLRDWRVAYKAKHPNRTLSPEIANEPHIPYHERMNAYWAKVAPMPRAVGVTGPAISR